MYIEAVRKARRETALPVRETHGVLILAKGKAKSKKAVEFYSKQPGYVGLAEKQLRGSWTNETVEWTDNEGNRQTNTARVKRDFKVHPLVYYHMKEKKLGLAEYTAGLRYYRACVIHGGQTNMSIDLSMGGLGVRIQTSGRPEPLNPSQIDAANDIKIAMQAVGIIRSRAFHMITGEGHMPSYAAREIEKRTSQRAAQQQRDLWFDDLGRVAKAYGY